MTVPLGWSAGIALAAAMAAGTTGYLHGRDVGRDRCEREQRAALDQAQADRDRLRGQIERGALEHLKAEQEREASHREIVREETRIVERPVYRGLCVDADGVRLLDRTAALANGPDRTGPSDDAATALSAGGSPGGRDDGRAVSVGSD